MEAHFGVVFFVSVLISIFVSVFGSRALVGPTLVSVFTSVDFFSEEELQERRTRARMKVALLNMSKGPED